MSLFVALAVAPGLQEHRSFAFGGHCTTICPSTFIDPFGDVMPSWPERAAACTSCTTVRVRRICNPFHFGWTNYHTPPNPAAQSASEAYAAIVVSFSQYQVMSYEHTTINRPILITGQHLIDACIVRSAYHQSVRPAPQATVSYCTRDAGC